MVRLKCLLSEETAVTSFLNTYPQDSDLSGGIALAAVQVLSKV